MDNEQKVIVACPKCGQKLKCVLGGAGTCPKCGTRVVFPEHMSQADPALNKEFFSQLVKSKTNQYEEGQEKPRKASKSRGILKKIIIGILVFAVIGGGVFAGLKLKDSFFPSSTENQSDTKAGNETTESKIQSESNSNNMEEDNAAQPPKQGQKVIQALSSANAITSCN